MNTCSWICLFGLASLLVVAAPAAGGVADVKVTTDRSIDCSSMATIARDLYRDCKTDQEKAIATWYFVRRMHFHWPHIPTWDSIDLINSYGFALCGYQSTMFVQICSAGGLKARTMHPQNHMIAEAFYDGGWHMFDCQVGWYALNRKGKVASCAELKKDPTLVTKAVEEGRASKPYFQCRDSVTSGTNYAATARTGGTRPAPKKRLVINLRRGESITRVWGNEGKSWHKPNETKWTQPGHGCTGQSIDANDPVNWPYWKPYAKVRGGSGDNVRYGIKRYYGNGRMVYAPDLSSVAWRKDLPKGTLKNIAAAAPLMPARGDVALVPIVIECPYVIVDAWIDLTFVRKNDDDLLAIHAHGKRGPWKEVWKATEKGKTPAHVSLKDAAWASHKYSVQLVMKRGSKPTDLAVEKLRITTVFMNNMYALPYFMPGKNTIRLTAAEGDDVKENKLTLEYAWAEQGKDKTLTKQIAKLPFECSVNVAGKELPRMKHVRLSVAP